MPKFKVNADRLYKVWYNETMLVEADSVEEVLERMKEGDFDDHLNCEVIFETEQAVENKYDVQTIELEDEVVWKEDE